MAKIPRARSTVPFMEGMQSFYGTASAEFKRSCATTLYQVHVPDIVPCAMLHRCMYDMNRLEQKGSGIIIIISLYSSSSAQLMI